MILIWNYFLFWEEKEKLFKIIKNVAKIYFKYYLTFKGMHWKVRFKTGTNKSFK